MKSRGAKDEKARSYRMGARALAVEETVKRILAATYELFLERRYDEIHLKMIAERAGVSLQTIMNRFGSKEAVFSQAITQAVDAQRGAAVPGDAASAIASLVRDYEKHGDAVLRILALEEQLPATKALLEHGRGEHRAWVERTFADRLPAEDGPERRRRLAQLVAATDVYTWKLLRRDAGLGLEDTTRSMVELVEGLKTIRGRAT